MRLCAMRAWGAEVTHPALACLASDRSLRLLIFTGRLWVWREVGQVLVDN